MTHEHGVKTCPNTEFFLVRINTRKYKPENTPYLDTFHAVELLLN